MWPSQPEEAGLLYRFLGANRLLLWSFRHEYAGMRQARWNRPTLPVIVRWRWMQKVEFKVTL